MRNTLDKEQIKSNRAYKVPINRNSHKINTLIRSIGVEYDYEIDGDEYIEPFCNFKNILELGTDDHYELRTVPASGDNLLGTLAAVAALSKVVEQPFDYENYGYHVHVDALDLSTSAILRVIYAWQYAEGYIRKQVVHKDRRKSEYTEKLNPLRSVSILSCTGLKVFSNTDQIKNMLEKVYCEECCDGVKFNNKDSWWFSLLDTDGFNFSLKPSSFIEHGTLEFRCKEAIGPDGPSEDLVFWPLFCGWFVEACANISDQEMVRILNPNWNLQSNKAANWNKFMNLHFPMPITNWFINHA